MRTVVYQISMWFACKSGERGEKNYLVKIVVLSNKFFKLRLDIHDLRRGEVKLDDGNASFLEVLEEAHFGGLQEHQTATLAFLATCGTTDTVNVVTGVIWGVELDDPVDGRDLRFSVLGL